jgi:DNA repair photolyase
MQKGRGAQLNSPNRFQSESYHLDPEFLEHGLRSADEDFEKQKTQYREVYPKSILNRVNSPDIGPSWSMNPYQGCEHGCAYCYARNSHEYWGFSAGTDFETQIMVKKNAPQLLAQSLQKPSWQAETIMLSGNTDCYQPIERKLAITRALLKVLLQYRQPVGIITKNSLVLRDLDLLQELSKKRLVKVSISLTSLDDSLRRKLEPRTASAIKRLKTIETLAAKAIPVNLMLAPIIPGLNSHEIMSIAKAASEAGALSMHYSLVRLNGQIATIFEDWAQHHYPDRWPKIAAGIAQSHGGKLNDSQFGRRLKGAGPYAEQIKQTVALARKRYFKGRQMPEYDRSGFLRAPKGQTSLDL